MKILIPLAIAAAMVVSTTSAAQQLHEGHHAAPTVIEWSKATSEKLQRNLRALLTVPRSRETLPQGLVVVRFNCSDNGAPSAMTFSRRSNSSSLNRLAMRTVVRLKNMHPLPEGIKEGQVYEAVISLASDEEQADRQMLDYQRTLASRSGKHEVLALVVTSTSPKNL